MWRQTKRIIPSRGSRRCKKSRKLEILKPRSCKDKETIHDILDASHLVRFSCHPGTAAPSQKRQHLHVRDSVTLPWRRYASVTDIWGRMIEELAAWTGTLNTDASRGDREWVRITGWSSRWMIMNRAETIWNNLWLFGNHRVILWCFVLWLVFTLVCGIGGSEVKTGTLIFPIHCVYLLIDNIGGCIEGIMDQCPLYRLTFAKNAYFLL